MKNSKFIQRIQGSLLLETGSIDELRQRILAVLIIVIDILIAPILLVNLPNWIAASNYVFMGFMVVAYVYLLGLAVFRKRIAYNIRAISMAVLTYLASILALNNLGLVGTGKVWMLFFILFTTIMLGFRAGIVANLIAIASLVGLGFMTVNGIMTIQTSQWEAYSLEADSWSGAVVSFLLISVVLNFFTGLIIRGIERGRESLLKAFDETQELTRKLEDEQTMLAVQTMDLERRLTQIRTAAEISRTLGTILDPQDLLQQVADLIQQRFNLYYVGVFQVDENRRFALLVAGTGEAGQNMIAENHQLSVGGSSMVGWAVSHGEPRISLDVGQEAVRFQNPHLPETRSEIALPIRIGKQTTGAISVQSASPNAFDQDDITILQGIADSLAVALENASLFQQFESSLREIQQLNRQYVSESWQNVWAAEGQDLFAEKGVVQPDEKLNEINLPLRLRGEQIIGNITLATEQADLSDEDLEFVEAVSNQAAIALESARLLDEANRRVEQERALQELTNRFSRSLDFETLLKTIVEEIGQIPLVRETSIHITPPEMLEQPKQQPLEG